MKWKPVVNSQFLKLYEIALIVIFFSVMLLVIFPKGELEKYIKEEKKYIKEEKNVNPRLAIIYIEALERLKPAPEIKIMKAIAYLSNGDFDEAYRSVEGLVNIPLEENSLEQLYFILKRLYFTKQKEEERAPIYKDMEKVLKGLSKTDNLKRLEVVYKEAVSMAFHRIALDALVRINTLTKNQDIFWLEKAYRHSLELKEYTLAVRYLEYLLKTDEEKRDLWLREYYRLALAMDDPNLALDILVNLYNLDLSDKEKLRKDIAWLILKTNKAPEAYFKRYIQENPSKELDYLEIAAGAYKAKRDFYKAYQIYKELYSKTQNQSRKEALYKDILLLLLEAKDYNNLKKFIKNNYTNHRYNAELMKLTLRASLATGYPDFAYMIAKNIARWVR